MSQQGLDRMRLHSYSEFQHWLAQDIEIREELEALIGQPLDLDTASLDVLEAFILIRYQTMDDALTLSERGILDAVARHIGLVMLLNIDEASWAIELEDEDNIYYRLPIIRFSDGAEECPLTLATAALDRRTGSFIRMVVEGYEEDYNLSSV
ncbi:MAG: hypothetical protein SF053_16170 [Bacteroidia bacterium]|nr:hypothetical protein [Bacteroidia bacterium]